MIYSGYLIDYVCQGETLDRLYLAETQKREFKQNKMNEEGNYLHNKPGQPVPIESHIMSIPYSSIINLNLHFITFPDFGDIDIDSDIESSDMFLEVRDIGKTGNC